MSETPLPPVGPTDTARQMDHLMDLEPVRFEQKGSSLIATLTPLYIHLLADARTHATTKQEYRFAVILAHAACDLATEDALVQLLRRRQVDLLHDFVLASVGHGVCLDNQKAQRLYVSLADENPAGDEKRGYREATWWKQWAGSRKLRHHVAHAGRQVTADQALACVEASDQYVAHLAATVERIGSSGN
jgi:hypothetical protein